MICLIALLVFGVLSVFSVKYRALAAEAFDCVFRRVTLRKCNTSFDKKMKTKISMRLFKTHKGLGGFVYKNFEALSWAFTLLMIGSLAFSVLGAYNYFAYGNCNGPHSTEVCVFNPQAPEALSCGSEHCAEEGCECGPKDTNCTPETGFAPCDGDCNCYKEVCG